MVVSLGVVIIHMINLMIKEILLEILVIPQYVKLVQAIMNLIREE